MIIEDQIEEIRTKLKDFVSPEEGESLRLRLEKISNRYYIRRNRPESYLKYMNINECSFRRNGPQSTNHPYVWTMFSVPSQHVMGDCVEECLDKAIEKTRFVV